MKLMKGSDAIVVSSLEDMVRLNNINMASVANNFARLIKKNKKLSFIALLNCAGVLYLISENKKRADDVDRLKEEQLKLSDEIDRMYNAKTETHDKEDYWG